MVPVKPDGSVVVPSAALNVSVRTTAQYATPASGSERSKISLVVKVALPLGSIVPESAGELSCSQKRVEPLRERRTSKLQGSSGWRPAPQVCDFSEPVTAYVPSAVPGSCPRHETEHAASAHAASAILRIISRR